ncbi:MAG TPA: hypothetical protein VFN95_01830 [Flavitalea sp.]|nr:hypothetical protein [Flavitalea sp.]
MDSLIYLIILRLLHISCGVFWGGTAIYLSAFVTPAVKASGPEGGKFMQQLARTNKLPMVMTITSTITILAGVLLIWKLSGGFQYEWMLTTHGLILNVGALLAIIAYFEGLFITRPTVLKINKLSQQIGSDQPTLEQAQQLIIYRKKMVAATNSAAILLGISVIAMSINRYL